MDLKQQLERDEGIEKSAYQDSLGYWTIGVGRLIDKRKGGGLSDSEIDLLLDNDIKNKTAELVKSIPWCTSLDEARLGVLLNMSFQLGVNGLLAFKNTVQAVKDKRYLDASKEMLDSTWAKQTPERAQRLSKQMATGIWQ